MTLKGSPIDAVVHTRQAKLVACGGMPHAITFNSLTV